MMKIVATVYQYVSVLFWLSVTLQLHFSESTNCYSCTDVAYVASCHSVIKCPPGYSCHATVHANKYTLGCKENKLCHFSNTTSVNPGGSESIVGRSAMTSVLNNCSECCETSRCNRQLCQNNVAACQDSGHIDCVTTGSFVNLCAETGDAKLECKRFCGLCSLVDGSWSDWTEWSSCSASCGNGTVTRSRSCSNPAPANGGSDCTGERRDTQACTAFPEQCPVNGGWSNWSDWNSCSVTCGIGLQRRDRTCSSPYPSNSGVHCFGDARDDRICLPGACQDGGWADWGDWTACTTTCDVCTQKRYRTCTNPPPSVLGTNCVGDDIDVKTYLLKACVNQEIGFTVDHQKDTDTPGRITFTNVITNTGGGYNTTSGEFTCTVAGVYAFSLNILKSPNATEAWCSIYQNSKYLGIADVDPKISTGFIPASTTVYVHLVPGDRVYLSGCTTASTMYGFGYSSFSGYLIHMD